MNFGTFVIIFIFIAIIYLYYKYKKIENYKEPTIKKIQPKKIYNKQCGREALPHMTYSAGPFDEYIWGYPCNGGKSIKSQRAAI